jgi:hypothetical protein
MSDGTVVSALNDVTVICVLNVGMLVCALDDALFLFLFLEVDFVDKLGTVGLSAVGGDITYTSLNRLPVMAIDGDDIQHFPLPYVDAYPAVTNSLMERSESQNVGI